MIKIFDSSGIKNARVIEICQHDNTLNYGVIVKIAVQELFKNAKAIKSSLHFAMMVNLKKPMFRKNGTVIYFKHNAAVLMKHKDKRYVFEPLYQINCFIPYELQKQFPNFFKGVVSVV